MKTDYTITTAIPDDVPIEKPSDDKAIIELVRRVYEVRNNPFRLPNNQEADEADEEDGELAKALYGMWDDTKFPEFDDEGIKHVLGRKWKVCISQLYNLVSYFNYRTSSKHVTTLDIPQTDPHLIEIFNSQPQVHNVIQMATKVGLIVCVDENYAYGSAVENFSKLYAWNKPRAKQIKDIARKNRIRRKGKKSVLMKLAKRNHGKKLKSASKKFDIDLVKISQRTMIPLSLTNDEIVDVLRYKYPQLAWAQDTAIRLNENLPDDEQIKANPKIRRSDKFITKIGFRITNPLVNLKEHENENKDYNGRWRKEALDEKLGEWVEYDVRSSIYRVHYLIKHGVWLDDSVDLYQEMAGIKFPDEEARKQYKAFAMKLYFEPSTSAIATHLAMKSLDKTFLQQNEKYLTMAWNRMRECLGSSFQSEIFLHEGCIYLEAFRRMVEEKHWRVIQVYDGFYVKKDGMDSIQIKNEMQQIVEDSAYWYRNTFLTSNNNNHNKKG